MSRERESGSWWRDIIRSHRAELVTIPPPAAPAEPDGFILEPERELVERIRDQLPNRNRSPLGTS